MMNIEIGKKIRELRDRRLVTQEQLAVFLGVTPQAVSRWESQHSYPDIEFLPAIADYFSVTTDELLGVRKDERALRLAEIGKEIERLGGAGATEEIIAFARQAVAEFPSEESLQLHLADSLLGLIWAEDPDKDALSEAEKIFQTVLETTRDISIQCQAIAGLMTYCSFWLDDDARALELAGRLPALKDCREFARAWHVRNNTGSYLQKAIELCTAYLTVNIKELVMDTELPNDGSTWERKIRMLKTANEITRMIFGEDMMYHHAEVSNNLKRIAVFQLALGRIDDALDSLEEMAGHAVACVASRENDHGKRFASPFVDALVYTGTDEYFSDDEQNQCRYCLELLKERHFDPVRDNDRFRAVVKKLESRAT